MRVIYVLSLFLGLTFAYEEVYSIERDDSPMAKLARDFMPHIRTREQLWEMQYQLRANMNEYVDRMLSNSKEFFLENELDPMRLPDFIRTFSHTDWLGITWHGELIVNNGRLTDLTTIFRSGNVNLDYKDRQLLLDANIGFKDLVFGYDFSAKFMGIGPKGYVTGRADDINVEFKITIDLDAKTAKLDLFDIKDIRMLSAHLNGLGVFLDWLLDGLANIVLLIFKGPIVNLIEKEVGNVLGNVLSNLDLGSFLPQIYG